MKRKATNLAACDGRRTGAALELLLKGRLTVDSVPDAWSAARRWLEQDGLTSVRVDGTGVEHCDGAGTALLIYLRRAAKRMGASIEFAGLREDIADMMALYGEDAEQTPPARRWSPREFVEEIGRVAAETLAGLKQHIEFLGELSVGLGRTIIRPAGMRMQDFMRTAETSGAQALPIIGLLGFLVGLILAFQGAVLMAQFGAEIYIADFVGKSVTRELGPLITAIIVAGRTGSAFAAEIGTMKVNEEIDAFTTMGLDPVRFLVIPRVLGATLMTPLLGVLTNLFGLAGGAVVMRGIGFPMITYINRVMAAVTMTDYMGGLLKTFVFGLLISSSGCLCGLRTGNGASAVGDAATRAVVSSIIMIVLADGVFAVAFYFLGI